MPCGAGCRSNVEFVATKKGMSAALALAVQGSSELIAYSFDRLTKAVGALLDRAVAAGEIRSDIGPEDLLRALVGMCYMHDQPGWQKTRAAAAGRLRRRPSRAGQGHEADDVVVIPRRRRSESQGILATISQAQVMPDRAAARSPEHERLIERSARQHAVDGRQLSCQPFRI